MFENDEVDLSDKHSRLRDVEDVLKEMIPGIKMRYNLGEARFDFVLNYHTVDLHYVNVSDAKQYARGIGEQIRIRASRELGLDPILDGMRREVEFYRRGNLIMKQTIDMQKKRIRDLEASLAANDEAVIKMSRKKFDDDLNG